LRCRDDFLEGLQPFEFRFGTGRAGYRCVRATDSRGEDRSGAKLPFRTEGRVFPIAGDGQCHGFAGVPSISRSKFCAARAQSLRRPRACPTLARRHGTPLPNLSRVVQLLSRLTKTCKAATRSFSTVPDGNRSVQLWRCVCSTDKQALSRSGLSYADLLIRGDR
jgi:hypothetical protein